MSTEPESMYGVSDPFFGHMPGNPEQVNSCLRRFMVWGPETPDPVWNFFAERLLGNPAISDANVVVVQDQFVLPQANIAVSTPLLDVVVQTRRPLQWEIYCYPNPENNYNNAPLAIFLRNSLLAIAQTCAEIRTTR